MRGRLFVRYPRFPLHDVVEVFQLVRLPCVVKVVRRRCRSGGCGWGGDDRRRLVLLHRLDRLVNEGAAEETGAGTGGASKNMLPTPTRAAGRDTWGAAAAAPGGRGGGGAFTGFGGALGFQPGGISPIPGSICGRLPIAGAGAAPVIGAAMSRRVMLTFCSSAGAALQPNTVQPPFSV